MGFGSPSQWLRKRKNLPEKVRSVVVMIVLVRICEETCSEAGSTENLVLSDIREVELFVSVETHLHSC